MSFFARHRLVAAGLTPLVCLGILALHQWTPIRAVQVAIEVGHAADPGPFTEAERVQEAPTMVAYLESEAFEPYRADYLTHDTGVLQMRAEVAKVCADVNKSVWLPPFTGMAERECATWAAQMEDAHAQSAQVRAFLTYAKECRRKRFRAGYYDQPEGGDPAAQMPAAEPRTIKDFPHADFANWFDGQTVDGFDLGWVVMEAVAKDCDTTPETATTQTATTAGEAS